MYRLKQLADIEDVLGRAKIGRQVELFVQGHGLIEVANPVDSRIEQVHGAIMRDAEQPVEFGNFVRSRRFAVKDIVEHPVYGFGRVVS